MKIVETDNMGGDYPAESFLNLPSMPKEACESVADVINKHCCYPGPGSRFWKVVEANYTLAPGFEP